MNNCVVTDDKWLLFPQPNPAARLRLFCFPHAGSGAFLYREWVKQLPPEVEICGVQLPGRENRLAEPPFQRLEPLVRAVAAVLPPHIDRPFALFGHSLGAIVAFEVARILRQEHGLVPVHLMVSGRAAPQTPERRDPPFHRLPEAEFLRTLRGLGGTPAAVLANAELMRLLVPLLRADFAVNETYRYTPDRPLAMPLTVLRGEGDTLATAADVAGWRDHTTDGCVLHTLPGGHFFPQTNPRAFFRVLRTALLTTLRSLDTESVSPWKADHVAAPTMRALGGAR